MARRRTGLLRVAPALAAALCLALISLSPNQARADWRADINQASGGGSLILAEGGGTVVLALRADRALVPASILKLVTAGAALKALGPDYRFRTDFNLTQNNDLVISGRGDPLLISEEISLIADRLKGLGLTKVNRILVEDSFFRPDIKIPGRGNSLNPYDAFSGALSVNFNSIAVKISAKGRVASAEPQTPLTPLARKEALASGQKGRIRISLAKNRTKCLLYAAQLFKAVFIRQGLSVKGPAGVLKPGGNKGKLFYRHLSSRNLAEVIAGMMKYSNNFIANQIFLTLGAELYGPPAEPAKGQRAVRAYLVGLGLKGVSPVEGSGLSRQNRISARQMLRVLADFQPYRSLLPVEGRLALKTGTLTGVRSLAGYIDPQKAHPARFVIILNGRSAAQGRREKLAEMLVEALDKPKK